MNWEKRPVKAQARDWLFNIVSESLPKSEDPLTYIGLPAGQAIFEKRLRDHYGKVNLTLFERDKIVLKDLMKIQDEDFVKDPNVESEVYWSELGPFLCRMTKADARQVAWLDYCGPVTPDRLKSLRHCLSIRPQNGIVAATFMAGRERPNGNTILDFFDESYMGVDIDYDKELVPGYFLRRVKAVSELARGVDSNIDIQVLPYKDRAPMMLFVFKDCKGARPTIEIEPYTKE
jgi:hypothetical protein